MIDQERVSDIFEECFISRGTIDGKVHVDSMGGFVSFENDKIELHKQEIENMLCELPIEFRRTDHFFGVLPYQFLPLEGESLVLVDCVFLYTILYGNWCLLLWLFQY
jgi:hypothetical protein